MADERIKHLELREMLGDTRVVCATKFGRTPFNNVPQLKGALT